MNDITVDDLRKHHKVEYIHKFQWALINNSGKSKQVVCDIAGVSNNTLTRYMKDLGMKSFYRHDHKINRKKDREVQPKKQEKVKTKSKAQRSSKGGAIKPEDISDEYIDKLIN